MERRSKHFFYILLSIFVSYILISFENFLWARDRLNYLNYAKNGYYLLNYNIQKGFLTFLSNEPLFLMINGTLGLFFEPEIVVKIIIFISSLVFLYSIGQLTNDNYILIILFWALPSILIKYTTHLRQGLAMALYYLGLVGAKNKKKWHFVRYLSPFIHSSMFFLLFFEFFESFFKRKRFAYQVRLIFFTLISTLAIIQTSRIAFFLGDRRAVTYKLGLQIAGSGLGLLFWVFMGILYIVFSRKSYWEMISLYGILFYITTYFYLEYGSRVFESILPLIIVTVLNNNNKLFKFLFMSSLLIFNVVIWLKSQGSML